jgi:putative transposase
MLSGATAAPASPCRERTGLEARVKGKAIAGLRPPLTRASRHIEGRHITGCITKSHIAKGVDKRALIEGPSAELIAAIVEIKQRNPKFGCVRIAQQIAHAFGIDIDKDIVRRVLAKHYRPGHSGSHGPSWLTFIAHTKDSLWSLDRFRCESILLGSHWVMLVMDVFTRRIIGFGVESGGLDGITVCRMFNRASRGQSLPKHASTDHDPLFRFHRWLANLRVLEIGEIKSVPYAPVSHPFVERLIGTVRREYLDRVFFWNSADLMRKLEAFRGYYKYVS